MEEKTLSTRYFKKKDPRCMLEKIEWVEMTGEEFYRFANSPEGHQRHFIDMDDIVLEVTEAEARQYKAEKNHHYYIQAQEAGWSTVSIYTIEDEHGCSGEEVVRDDTQDVEAEVILRIEHNVLQTALYQLDEGSRLLIHALYLADERSTERDLAHKLGISQNAVNKRKKKILKKLKLLVVKIEKSQQ